MPATTPRATRPPYPLDPRFYDEAFDEDGGMRDGYARLLSGLEAVDLDALERTVAADLASRGVDFAGTTGHQRFRVDPIPRLIAAEEWSRLAAGLAQRVRALNAFIADVYGKREIFAAGVVPERVLAGAGHLEPTMRDIDVPHGIWATVAGLDLVRGADGGFMVLEDNLRTPSGLAYAEAARDVLEERLPLAAQAPKLTLRSLYDELAGALRSAAPEGIDEPSIALLSDGSTNSAWFEHRTIAQRLHVPLVALADLLTRSGRLHARIDGVLRPIDVLYRRTDEDRLSTDAGGPTALAEVVLEPLRRGRLSCVNAFGAGIADDKLVHAYVEEMVRHYLGEEPALPSVTTYDLSKPAARAEVLDRLDELVVKPRIGHGGQGIVIGPHATRADLAAAATAIRHAPEQFIAQETIPLSRHPTVCEGVLAPRHIDLRPFVISAADGVSVVPGGLTRVAFGRDALVVNSSQDGGGKDTWVLE
ncbi:MAG: circularly permuted type 2 ATP-grasp protein [Thermoleophilaceae bacterium]